MKSYALSNDCGPAEQLQPKRLKVLSLFQTGKPIVIDCIVAFVTILILTLFPALVSGSWLRTIPGFGKKTRAFELCYAKTSFSTNFVCFRAGLGKRQVDREID
jgi:hypothetical protein